jgi:hypothetical protein
MGGTTPPPNVGTNNAGIDEDGIVTGPGVSTFRCLFEYRDLTQYVSRRISSYNEINSQCCGQKILLYFLWTPQHILKCIDKLWLWAKETWVKCSIWCHQVDTENEPTDRNAIESIDTLGLRDAKD